MEIGAPLGTDEEEGIGGFGRSLFLSHGKRTPSVIVLFHGFTAAPTQFADLGATLHARGANVSIPRLPRHGREDRMTRTLEELTAAELTTFTQSSIEAARPHGERIVVAGFSLGGLMTAWAAQNCELDRAVAIAPFLGLAWLPHRLAARTARFVRRVPNMFLWWNPLVREALMPREGYPRYPTHAVADMYAIAGQLFDDAALHAPKTHDISLVLNASEVVVRNRTARRLAAYWSRDGKTRVEVSHLRGLPPSHDIITPDRYPNIVKRVYPQLVELVER